MSTLVSPALLLTFAVFIAAAAINGAVGLQSLHHSDAETAQCQFLTNQNTSSETFAPVKFLVSVQDCCAYCVSTPLCVAAVYKNYYCSLKDTLGVAGDALGSTLVLTAGSVTTSSFPPTTTTAAPTTATTTRQPTAAPPPTTHQPTQAPSVAPSPHPGSITIIREVECSFSSSCSRLEDYSCETRVYYNNTCNEIVKRTCTGSQILVEFYEDKGCTGGVTSVQKEPENVCRSADEMYYGHYCDVVAAPETGLKIKRSLCPDGCEVGSECRNNEFVSGECMTFNPFQDFTGRAVMAWCFPDAKYVVYLGFSDLNCSGTFVDSRSEPVSTHCFLDDNQDHIINTCEPANHGSSGSSGSSSSYSSSSSSGGGGGLE